MLILFDYLYFDAIGKNDKISINLASLGLVSWANSKSMLYT
jgi:hypothetical protein